MRIPKLDYRCRPDPTYRRLLGDEAWNRLSPAIRLRFGLKPAGREQICYAGAMSEVRCSRAGWLLAQLCRLIGTPLAPHRGRDVPVQARVFKEPGGEGLVWQRLYEFPGRGPVTVVSAKRPDFRAGLVEVVGGGFGMTLEVFEAEGALHFLSRRYFWQLGRLRLPLPFLLSPGTTHVVHADEPDGVHANEPDGVHANEPDGVHANEPDGVHANEPGGVHANEPGGRFRFTMTVRHPWLGETFFQDGVFETAEGF